MDFDYNKIRVIIKEEFENIFNSQKITNNQQNNKIEKIINLTKTQEKKLKEYNIKKPISDSEEPVLLYNPEKKELEKNCINNLVKFIRNLDDDKIKLDRYKSFGPIYNYIISEIDKINKKYENIEDKKKKKNEVGLIKTTVVNELTGKSENNLFIEINKKIKTVIDKTEFYDRVIDLYTNYLNLVDLTELEQTEYYLELNKKKQEVPKQNTTISSIETIKKPDIVLEPKIEENKKINQTENTVVVGKKTRGKKATPSNNTIFVDTVNEDDDPIPIFPINSKSNKN